MSLDELISIERVEFQATKERIQETYVISNLALSKLFKEVLKETEMDILPILDMRILLYVLRSVLFTDEEEGVQIIETLNECMKFQLYGESDKWKCKRIAAKIKMIRSLILLDYAIEGSLKLYSNSQIEWDLGVSISIKTRG
ncbi:MAG: hypothetical protein ACXAC5_06735 [Promethearchaeota archaeon]